MRPCSKIHPDSTLPLPGQPYDLKTCRYCWLYVNTDEYKAMWDSQQSCMFLREFQSIQEQVEVFSCKLHGKCTLKEKLNNIACCATCNDYNNGHITVNQAAGGIGDALLGLVAINGLSYEKPNNKIIYKVAKHTIQFVKLFGGYHFVMSNNVKNNKDRQVNIDENNEKRTGHPRPYWLRYCNNIGVLSPRLPVLKEKEYLLELGKEYSNVVVLSPFSAVRSKNYYLYGWLTLLEQLKENNYRVVVIDDNDDRCKPFKCEKLINANAKTIAGMLLNSRCLISNDSGMAHLSGIMGKDTIVLCGPSEGVKLFGFYENMHYLSGNLACNTCWWQSYKGYDKRKCDFSCVNMQTIKPEEIISLVKTITNKRGQHE